MTDPEYVDDDWRWDQPLRSPADPVGTAEQVRVLDYLQWAADQCIRQSECLRAHLEKPQRVEIEDWSEVTEGQAPSHRNDLVSAFIHTMNLREGVTLMQKMLYDNADELDQALIQRVVAAREVGIAVNVVVEDGRVKTEIADTAIPNSVEEWLREQGS